MWDERYAVDEFVYGKEPNTFLAEHYLKLPKGKVLSLAEGEGRNAVFLASQGYEVTAVDSSKVGLEKGRQLAEEMGVHVEWIHADLNDFDLGTQQWNGIVSIFCPLPSSIRQKLYQNLPQALKPGGVFVLEAYTPAQVGRGTGGGNSQDVMQTVISLIAELPGLTFNHLQELEREVVEGIYHTGKGCVVQAIAQKL
jgi:SAM-dependent methyltransferase